MSASHHWEYKHIWSPWPAFFKMRFLGINLSPLLVSKHFNHWAITPSLSSLPSPLGLVFYDTRHGVWGWGMEHGAWGMGFQNFFHLCLVFREGHSSPPRYWLKQSRFTTNQADHIIPIKILLCCLALEANTGLSFLLLRSLLPQYGKRTQILRVWLDF